jgi:hypothetical protein
MNEFSSDEDRKELTSSSSQRDENSSPKKYASKFLEMIAKNIDIAINFDPEK